MKVDADARCRIVFGTKLRAVDEPLDEVSVAESVRHWPSAQTENV